MLSSKATDLINELERSKHGNLPPFNEDSLRQIFTEMNTLFRQNHEDVNNAIEGDEAFFASVHLRHAALERNKRCVLAYIYNRLQRIKDMRWQLGSVLPDETKQCLSEHEIQWFNKYSKNLTNYMRNLGREGEQKGLGEGEGLDLTQDLQPPKDLYIEVRCLEDYGELDIDGGEVVVLQKNSTHFLPMADCQHLIRQGILKHIDS